MSSPAAFWVTQVYSPQSSCVILNSLITTVEVPLPWLLTTFRPLCHVTLRRDNPLAIQLRFTFTPVLRIGGMVMSVIRGKSAMARNKFMAREWINFQLFTTRIILLGKPLILAVTWRHFPFSPKFRKFSLEMANKTDPFWFGPTGVSGTTFESSQI